jgi:methyl-accepting chemotaxis protein
MSFMAKMRIGGRFRLAFGGMVFTLIVSGAVSLYQATQLDRVASDLGRNAVPSGVIMAQLAEALTQFRQLQAAAILASTSDDKAAIARQRSETLSRIQAKLQAYQPYVDEGRETDVLMPAIRTAWQDYQAQDAKLQAKEADPAAAAHFYINDLGVAFGRLHDAVVADMDYSARTTEASIGAADAVFVNTAWTIGGMTILGAALGIVAAFWLNRHVTARVVRLSGVMRQLANHDYAFDLPCALLPDEIGDMARAMNDCRDGLKEADSLAETQKKEQQSKAQRTEKLDSLVRSFESKIGDLVAVLSSGAADLQGTAGAMSSTASQAGHRAITVAAAAQQASAGVQTVAAAAEELSSSISEISRQIAHSSEITSRAVADAQRTNTIVQALSESAQRIGHVVGLITNIAGQTNLLALNATIEAARAGDAGKGFAVVASEVKSLASQTANATEEISSQINQIQSATREAVDAIRAITSTVEEVSAIATGITAAVAEQGAATAEIARNVQQTAQAAQDVTMNIGDVNQAVNDTGAAANQVLGSANSLSSQSNQLASEVNIFVSGVRAA